MGAAAAELELRDLRRRMRQAPAGGGDLRDAAADAAAAAARLEALVLQADASELQALVRAALPCVLTALDHFSPAVKRASLVALGRFVRAAGAEDLAWFGPVTLDALCHNLVACHEELWPLAVPLVVGLATRLESANPRSLLYSQVFETLLGEMERYSEEVAWRLVWLDSVQPLVQALGLVLLAHFKRLLPLLLHWLHSLDEATVLKSLAVLNVTMRSTWPRAPAHKQRIESELDRAEGEAKRHKGCREIQERIKDARQLLNTIVQKCAHS
eukprot:SM000007S20935  [mRNA]  locus=s7:1019285:1021366:- [translate_table: standard]